MNTATRLEKSLVAAQNELAVTRSEFWQLVVGKCSVTL